MTRFCSLNLDLTTSTHSIKNLLAVWKLTKYLKSCKFVTYPFIVLKKKKL